ncbi:MAG: DciA family protein [Candidatus Omnitrophota bacterium]|nr:DciA family protein [Candidatus Omnitrophota bacterium]
MDDIRNIVDSVLKNLSSRTQPTVQEEIQKAWERIVKDQGLKHARVAGFHDGVLNIHIDSPAWLYQLNLKRKKITEDMQKSVPDVKKIYFKIGKVQ